MRWAPFTQRCSYFLVPLPCTVNARNSAQLQTSVRLALWNTHHTLLMPLMTKVWHVHSLREWSTNNPPLFVMLKTHAQIISVELLPTALLFKKDGYFIVLNTLCFTSLWIADDQDLYFIVISVTQSSVSNKVTYPKYSFVTCNLRTLRTAKTPWTARDK